MDKIKGWFFEEEERFDDAEDVYEEPAQTVGPDSTATSIFEAPKSPKTREVVRQFDRNSNLVLFEPRAYSETQDIATYLKSNQATVVNLHRLHAEQSKRVIDFLSGVIYAIDGDIQQIGSKIFLCTPKSMRVSGTISLDRDEDEA